MPAIAQGGNVGSLACMASEQRIKRIRLPQALGVIAPCRGRVVKRQEGTHVHLPNCAGSGFRFWAKASESSWLSSVSK